jgi:mannose-6-phosphate isomerase-like protein (cupin superfamily)
MTFGVGIWKPGDAEREFSHEAEEVLYVLRGSGTLKMDQEEARIGPDTCGFVPSKALHQVINDGVEDLIVLWVHSPPIKEELES